MSHERTRILYANINSQCVAVCKKKKKFDMV